MLSPIVPPLSALEFALNRGPRGTSCVDSLYRAIQRSGEMISYTQDENIYEEGEQSLKVFVVVSGAVRICKFRRDGQRQIEAFYLPGEFFGFNFEEESRFTAEAAADTTLLAANAAAVATQQAKVRDVAGGVWQVAVQDLHRSQDHVLLLGCRNAQERILTFLDEMAGRLKRTSTVDLPMSRQDIADYLGLTIETVSRTFTALARRAIIDMPHPRRVILKNRIPAKCIDAGAKRGSREGVLASLM